MRIHYKQSLLYLLTFVFPMVAIAGSGSVKFKNDKPKSEESNKHRFTATFNPAKFDQNRSANMDTLVWLDFEGTDTIPDQNSGGTWLNIDYDGIAAEYGTYHYPGTYNYYIDSVDQIDLSNGMDLGGTQAGISVSWLAGFAPGNRNALVTPAISVTKSGTMVSFNAMPAQGPQWGDGFTLQIDQFANPQGTVDTAFQTKQYGGSGDGPVWDPSFMWNNQPGDSLHEEYSYDSTYFLWGGDSGNASVGWEYYEVSLDAYIGQTIYIHWYHDSDDDNAIILDNIGVFEPQSTALTRKEDFYLKAYPNPASEKLNIDFASTSNVDSKTVLVNSSGEIIKTFESNSVVGMNKISFDISDVPAGIYLIRTSIGEKFNTFRIAVD